MLFVLNEFARSLDFVKTKFPSFFSLNEKETLFGDDADDDGFRESGFPGFELRDFLNFENVIKTVFYSHIQSSCIEHCFSMSSQLDA